MAPEPKIPFPPLYRPVLLNLDPAFKVTTSKRPAQTTYLSYIPLPHPSLSQNTMNFSFVVSLISNVI